MFKAETIRLMDLNIINTYVAIIWLGFSKEGLVYVLMICMLHLQTL